MATLLKEVIVQRDTTFAKVVVKLVLRSLESLQFDTPCPFAWSYADVPAYSEISNTRTNRIACRNVQHQSLMNIWDSARMTGDRGSQKLVDL
jgi:hypothetical protein